MVMFMRRAINDKTVSGTVKLSDTISKSNAICLKIQLTPRNPLGHEHVVCYPFIAGEKWQKEKYTFGWNFNSCFFFGQPKMKYKVNRLILPIQPMVGLR